MKLTEFLSICASIISFYPETVDNKAPIHYKRINTFSFIDDESELDSSNMGKDVRYKSSPHFFLRHWKEKGYALESLQKSLPAMFTYTKIGQIDHRKNHENIPIQFCIQDEYVSKFIPGKVNRTKEEIHQSLRDLRDIFLATLFEMVHVNVSGLPAGWYPMSFLKQNDLPTHGKKLSQFISLDIDASTFPRTPDAGYIETYFSIILLSDISPNDCSPFPFPL